MDELNYEFEPMDNGWYQVRLKGFFVCYSNVNDSASVDEYLKREGYDSRKEYVEACIADDIDFLQGG